ncbi:hypothetical protein JMUB7557_27810 [Staphylococcus aureus]
MALFKRKISLPMQVVIALVLGVVVGLLLYGQENVANYIKPCLLYTSPSPRDTERSRMPSSA